MFEWPDSAQQYQPAPLPSVLDAEHFCYAGDVANTLAVIDRCLGGEGSPLWGSPLLDLFPVFALACRVGPAALVLELLARGFAPSSAAEEAIARIHVDIFQSLKNAGWNHLGRPAEETVPGPLYLAVAAKNAD